MPDSTVIQFVYDTIKQIDTLKDTVFIANTALNSVKGSNNQLWTTFIPVLASMVTSVGTLVLFVLTYRKDIKFNKEKYFADQEKYKFEKAHLKRVEIAEKIYCDLMFLVIKLRICADHYQDNSLENHYISEISQKLEMISEYFGSIRLYLGAEHYTLVEQIYLNMVDLYSKIVNCNTNPNFDFNLNWDERAKLLLLLEELSNNIINEKSC